jgi:hypothetical protein
MGDLAACLLTHADKHLHSVPQAREELLDG